MTAAFTSHTLPLSLIYYQETPTGKAQKAMNDYIILSIETHLFFGRIMKEHSFFLQAGFPSCKKEWIEEADSLRQKFECFLEDVLKISDGHVRERVLCSGELVTEYTIPAEKRSSALSCIPIDSKISERTAQLRCNCSQGHDPKLYHTVHRLNQRALRLLRELISFKEHILREVSKGTLFTFNYPLLIKHILREARLYQEIVEQLLSNKNLTCQNIYETEAFWNQIMMEHAWFIRGLLDPSEPELIETANEFSKDYARLLEEACRKERCANAMSETIAESTLEETLKYRDFKAAGTKGILECKISSIILPLLADHVLREANHYLRMLETGRTQ